MLTFGCPACGKNLKAQYNKSGKISACPYCRVFVRVPSASVVEIKAELADSASGQTSEQATLPAPDCQQ
jgi:hypothetical protein